MFHEIYTISAVLLRLEGVHDCVIPHPLCVSYGQDCGSCGSGRFQVIEKLDADSHRPGLRTIANC